jgi:hypothetical protein
MLFGPRQGELLGVQSGLIAQPIKTMHGKDRQNHQSRSEDERRNDDKAHPKTAVQCDHRMTSATSRSSHATILILRRLLQITTPEKPWGSPAGYPGWSQVVTLSPHDRALHELR